MSGEPAFQYGLILAVCSAVAYGILIFNSLVRARHNVDKAWANVDVLLKQRHDELSKLLEICRIHMGYEKEALERVARARSALWESSGRPASQGKAEEELRGALTKLVALAEAYPDLKAHTSFTQLSGRVSDLESQISDRRVFYNASVNVHNARIESFPDGIFASWLGYAPREYFGGEVSKKI